MKIRLQLLFTLLIIISFGLKTISNNIFNDINLPVDEAKDLNYNSRSDTVNILHYTIVMDTMNFANSTISAYTLVTFTPKMNGVTQLNLDLLQLTIDSIKINNQSPTYSYNDTLLGIALPATMNIGDTATIKMAYHGHPVTDATFGGFTFSSGYAFNLGVGFVADPHNFGRVWHPCFDNFVERATYTFIITTRASHRAMCNGALTNQTTNGNGTITWTWDLDKEIPSYLASVSVAPYQIINKTFVGINATVPVELAGKAADTTAMKNFFIHLQNAFNIYENKFGYYRWNKVGYTMVPFNGGAMEHATNIFMGQVFLNGGALTYETPIMAHELSHHWFGDLVTCKTAQDMWLNEGLAEFSSFVFDENFYGHQAYKNAVLSYHNYVLQFAHYYDGGYYAVSGVPHDITYGVTVYKKGEDVAHTIRNYLGDSLFFGGVRSYLTNNEFKDVTNDIFRDALTAYSGIDLTDCFNDWVYNPGFPHFSIDSFSVAPSGSNFNVTVYFKQKLTGTTHYYSNVPFEITFKDANWNNAMQTVSISGQYQTSTFTIPFNPSYVALNVDCKISDAIVSENQVIKTTGNHNFPYSRFNLTVNQITDSVFLRVEHNFTKPDSIRAINTVYSLSPNHYWKIDGLLTAGFRGTATLPYEGRTGSYAGNYYLDNLLFSAGATEDSLQLLYRKNAAADWAPYPYYTKATGTNHADKSGSFTIDSIQKGEYVIGYKKTTTNVPEIKTESTNITVKPNPANNLITIQLSTTNQLEETTLAITDQTGKIIQTTKLAPNQTTINTAVNQYPSGIYNATIQQKTQRSTTKFIVTH